MKKGCIIIVNKMIWKRKIWQKSNKFQ